MTESQKAQPDCQHFTELLLKEAEAPLTEIERRFQEEHRASCADCRQEARVLAELRFDGSAPAAVPLDDLSRRRQLNDIVAAAAAADAAAEPEAAKAPGPARALTPWRRRLYYLGAAAAACLMLGAGYLVGRTVWGPAAGPVTQPRIAAQGRVLLRAGDVQLAGAPLRLDSALRPGQPLAVGRGRAAFRLPQGTTVLLGPDTRATVTQLGAQRVVIQLRRGSLLAAVEKRQPGQIFQVVTPAGRVSVKGTVFALRSSPAGTELRVYRGRVQVSVTGRAPQSVRAGQRLWLGTGAAPASGLLGDDPLRIRGERLLALLSRPGARESARLTVRTRPTGARAKVDDTELGLTPLAAVLEPGHRQLALIRTGHDAVRESLVLKAGDDVVRDYALHRTVASVAARPTTDTVGPAPDPQGPVRRPQPRAELGAPYRPAPQKAPEVVPPPATAQDLLARARQLRAARDYRGAARIYRTIAKRYPQSAEARVSWVSLGILLLGPLGRPADALAAYDRYLAITRRGDLAQEASYGRARALRALGRRAQEVAALKDFLRRYPKALQGPAARKRLGQLQSSGPFLK